MKKELIKKILGNEDLYKVVQVAEHIDDFIEAVENKDIAAIKTQLETMLNIISDEVQEEPKEQVLMEEEKAPEKPKTVAKKSKPKKETKKAEPVKEVVKEPEQAETNETVPEQLNKPLF